MSRKFLWITAALVAVIPMAQSARAGDMKIKLISPTGEDMSIPQPVDDHVVAGLSYEVTETTQLCGGPMGRTSMKILVHADGRYHAVETSSRLDCSRSGPVRKAVYVKHGGKLSMNELAKLWERLNEISEHSRDLAAASTTTGSLAGSYKARIQRAKDLRGV